MKAYKIMNTFTLKNTLLQNFNETKANYERLDTLKSTSLQNFNGNTKS